MVFCVVDVFVLLLYVVMLLGLLDFVLFMVYLVWGCLLFVLIVDYVGQQVFVVLVDLGLLQVELDWYIGWDIGIVGVICVLVGLLGVWVIEQMYLWLVIDCNCLFGVLGWFVLVSDYIVVFGNQCLDVVVQEVWVCEIFDFYYQCISVELDVCFVVGIWMILIVMYSFILVMQGVVWFWYVGVLYQCDVCFVYVLLYVLQVEGDLVVGDNQFYVVSDVIDYVILVYVEVCGLVYVELEICQDLIVDSVGQFVWV